MTRRRWVMMTTGWLAVTGIIIWVIGRLTEGDIAACLGLLVIWCSAVLWIAWYETAVVKQPFFEGEEQRWHAAAWARERRWYWPGLMLIMFLPGAWIGAVAHSPYLVAAGYLLTNLLIGRLNETIPPHLPPDPVRRRLDVVGFCQKMSLLLGGLLVGFYLQAVLRLYHHR